MQEHIAQKIHAILFYLGEPVSVSYVAGLLGVTKEDIIPHIAELVLNLADTGTRLVYHNDMMSLATAPEYAALIEKITKDDLEKDLGKAGLETLSIIAYRGPLPKKDIEYIRGVNCQFVLRHLLLRGLIERTQSPTDERVPVYDITIAALRFMGLEHKRELPSYEEVRAELAELEKEPSHE